MKTLLTALLLFGLHFASYGQYVSTIDIGGEVEGSCDQSKIYSYYANFSGNHSAKTSFSQDEILKRLNAEVTFIKDNPKHKDKGTLALVVNCKGELIICEMDDATKSIELDAQIKKVFNSLGVWKPAQLRGEQVDSCIFYNFRVKKGKISFT